MSWYKTAIAEEQPCNIDMSSLESFLSSLERLKRTNPDQLKKLSDKYEELRNAKKEPMQGKTKLFHGTSTKRKNKILEEGLRATEGERSGFMGFINTVENQGVFLAEDPVLARYFGVDRAEGLSQEAEVIECYVDTSKILDLTSIQIPKEIKRIGLQLVNEENGSKSKSTRIPKREWWWLMDQPKFIEAVKLMGYTGTKFYETSGTLKDSGSSGATYLVFDPSNVVIKENVTFGMKSFYNWMKNNMDFLTYPPGFSQGSTST